MIRKEILQAMTEIADFLSAEPTGVTWLEVRETYKATHATDPDFSELSAEIMDDYLKRCAQDIVNRFRRGNGQMTLPGIGIDVDRTVTIQDGEGGFRVKQLAHATIADMETDVEVMAENAAQAMRAFDRARDRNDFLIPLMREHGFTTAGEAIAWLSENA